MTRPLDYHVLSDETVGQGGFLTLRRLRLKVRRPDGTLSPEGLYDYVQRPMGLDAVVLVLWNRRADGVVEVLLRDGLRVPLHFGRDERRSQPPQRFAEVVAGILEAGEDDAAGVQKRAADEALEEAGLTVDAQAIALLGPPIFPTPGMCAELFYFTACEVSEKQRRGAQTPPGDGSPFEEGAQLRWLPLDDALGECRTGQISDMKTEIGLRRLADYLASK
jgi:ADP-ribose pyrophosphatase